MNTTKQRLACLGVLAILTSSAGSVQAQTYPDRPVKLLVGYAPGGGIDILGRFLAQQLGEKLGQQIVVENRAGASGAIAARTLATAPPDGYTLFMGESGTLVAPALQPANYDPVRDFAPVAQVGALVYGVAVHPDVPARTLDELVALIRQQPGKLNYGSPGVGNVVHLGAERLKRTAGLDIAHVPYKGGWPHARGFDVRPYSPRHDQHGLSRQPGTRWPRQAGGRDLKQPFRPVPQRPVLKRNSTRF